MSAPGSEHIVRFGVFELDLRAGELRREGIRLPVQGRPVQALAILLRAAGQVVTREELRTELWPADTFVDFEHGLHNAVARLRAVLGDTAENPRYIETLPRRGYRFIAKVEPAERLQDPPAPSVPEPSVAQPEKKRASRPYAGWALALGLAAVTAAAVIVWNARSGGLSQRIDSLAVLPFQNLSGDPEQEYFADGMTDAVTTDQAKIKALRLVSRTSLARYKGSRKTAPEIAREINVKAVLEGAVERAGDRVRITVRLVRANTDQPVWAESYEKEMRDVLRLQDDVARSIAREIQIEVTPEESAKLTSAREIDPAAYQAYLKGRYFWNLRTRDSVRKAIEYFEQAIQKDPSYAAAYSGLADCYSTLGHSFDMGAMAPAEVKLKALAAVGKAIALDPALAEAHTSLAFIKLAYERDWKGAEAEFERGIALDPRKANEHHWYAHYLIASGRTREAETESKRALDLEPLSPFMNVHLGWHYFYSRQYDLALEQLGKALELDPHYGLAYWYRGLAFEQKAMYADALREMRKAKEILPDNLVIDADIGHVLASAGNRAEANSVLLKLRANAAQAYVSPFGPALIHLGLGDREQALALLEEAYRQGSDMLIYLGLDPRLDALRQDERFRALVQRVGAP